MVRPPASGRDGTGRGSARPARLLAPLDGGAGPAPAISPALSAEIVRSALEAARESMPRVATERGGTRGGTPFQRSRSSHRPGRYRS